MPPRARRRAIHPGWRAAIADLIEVRRHGGLGRVHQATNRDYGQVGHWWLVAWDREDSNECAQSLGHVTLPTAHCENRTGHGGDISGNLAVRDDRHQSAAFRKPFQQRSWRRLRHRKASALTMYAATR